MIVTSQNLAKKILCIDDDVSLTAFIKKILGKYFKRDSLDFHAVQSGEKGLDLVDKLRPDLILCDVRLPDQNGFGVCRQIRERGFHTAIVMMSAFDSKEDFAIQTKESGGDGFLSKPFKEGDLLFVVNYLMRIDNLKDALVNKNRQLEESLKQVQDMHEKVAGLNQELRADKSKLNSNLKDVMTLNQQLDSKNYQISQMNEELFKRFNSTVSLLANIIELNQSQHRGHSERVGEIAVFISKKLELSQRLVQNIEIAAKIHELGIVSLPKNEKVEEVVDEDKSRKSTQHPLVGEMLLKGFPGFELIADYIRHMHENVDGTGKPDGLAGDQIPIGSRIISVASFYDHALISNPGKKPKDVFPLVQEKAGTLFDESVVFRLEEYIQTKNPEDHLDLVECSVFALEEGMELASDIYSESGINLLRRGTVLSQEILNKILKFNNLDPIVGGIKVRQY